ncbi:riboflavin kinase [Kineococcus rubinsiae]|uniref:riboflavin kinase n=1 Tax=Kineococcus rubinsiae TaxID=2609562 RepID=UPI001431FC8F|nr:riboflavin kinase [Kineococcus rubinsiae]NIZ90631.1 riboflavin kinase [Kineococcus rubinsiae]
MTAARPAHVEAPPSPLVGAQRRGPARDAARDAVLEVLGTVEHGDERGRLLGFPTANVAVPEHGLRDGVWAGTVQVGPAEDGPVHVAAVSIGHRPTFYGRDGERLLEAHLLDFEGDLYDRTVLVRLHVRLRPQRAYAGAAALVDQLLLDVAETRAWAQREGLGALLTTP